MSKFYELLASCQASSKLIFVNRRHSNANASINITICQRMHNYSWILITFWLELCEQNVTKYTNRGATHKKRTKKLVDILQSLEILKVFQLIHMLMHITNQKKKRCHVLLHSKRNKSINWITMKLWPNWKMDETYLRSVYE